MSEAAADRVARLERLRYAPTRYEIEMVLPDGRRYLVAYARRRSLRGLLEAVQQRGRAVVRVAGLPDDARLEKCGSLAFRVAGGGAASAGIVIRFSGRTQRDVVSSGRELPYVEDVAEASAGV